MTVSSCVIYVYVIFFYNFDTFMISKRLLLLFYCFQFIERSAIIMQWLLKIITSYFSLVTILSFSVNIISACSRSPLLVRNAFRHIAEIHLHPFQLKDTHLFLCFLCNTLFSSVGLLLDLLICLSFLIINGA